MAIQRKQSDEGGTILHTSGSELVALGARIWFSQREAWPSPHLPARKTIEQLLSVAEILRV